MFFYLVTFAAGLLVGGFVVILLGIYGSSHVGPRF